MLKDKYEEIKKSYNAEVENTSLSDAYLEVDTMKKWKKLAVAVMSLLCIGVSFSPTTNAYNQDYEIGYNRGYNDARHGCCGGDGGQFESDDFKAGYVRGNIDSQNDMDNQRY